MDLEMQCMEIITNVGSAKSMYIMAIEEAKQGNIEEAKKLVAEGEEFFSLGHHAHFELFNADFPKEFSQMHFLTMHAEDQLMAADSFKIIANQFIDLYELMKGAK